MLPDPIKLGPPLAGSGYGIDGALVRDFHLIPSPAGQEGRTIRVGVIAGLEASLTISHSVTKENKPYGTERLNLRLEATKLDSEGRSVTGFYQITGGHPKAIFTSAELVAIRTTLLSFALLGEVTEFEGSWPGTVDGGNNTFTRLAAGEA